MEKPIIADIKPATVNLKEGKEYHICTCGRSARQPFCDGSHKGTAFSPELLRASKSEDVYLCNCKHSNNFPFCDGTHQQFSQQQLGKEGPGISPAKGQQMPKAIATSEEPTLTFIHQLAKEGLSGMGRHGPMAAMGVPKYKLPQWDDIQIIVAQLDRKPLPEDEPVATNLILGPQARKPLELDIPLFVSDMSFGALSEEAKIALAKGAELAGTGICSGEGGMLPEEQAENCRYLYELASAKFGYSEQQLSKIQAFHFKAGQAAKTGTGGHLPGSKNTHRISEVRGIAAGEPAVSPPAFTDLNTPADYRKFADRVREISGGVPVGFKMSANHIEKDIEFALKVGVDYIILDGRGGGTGAAPLFFRDHISVPSIPAIARARACLDSHKASEKVTLIATGGLRTHSDFFKALALGADGIALANSAIQAIGCVGARICNSNNCPAGIATQKPELRQKLDIDKSAQQLRNFLLGSVELMKVMARACGHHDLNDINVNDLASWKREIVDMTGISYGGVASVR